MAKQDPSLPLRAGNAAGFAALSVWEIAHRWHGIDPNTTDPKNLPLNVQDTLRMLCQALLQQEIPACDQIGVDFVIRSTAPRLPQWQAEATPLERAAGYEAFILQCTSEQRSAVTGLERCSRERIYEREKLDSVYVSEGGIQQFCAFYGRSLPAFWFPNDLPEEKRPPRQSQLDKLACQAIARTLWDKDPSLTIRALIEDPAIRRYGNGAHYESKTLRQWLSEVDPRPVEAKTGRPRKAKPDTPPTK